MQSIIAAFKDNSTAKQAVERLVAQGFARSAIHLQSGYEDAAAPAAGRTSLADPFGFATFFSTLFGADAQSEAGKYAEAVRRGTTVVAVDVRSEGESDKATRVMQELGSIDVDQRAQEWQSQGWTGFDAAAKPLSREELSAEQEKVVPVVQEELKVGKRDANGGGVRVRSLGCHRDAGVRADLAAQRAHHGRAPPGELAPRPPTGELQGLHLDVRDLSEQVVVGKKARVVEEVVVGKEVTEHTEEVSDTVRRTDVEIERVADVHVERKAEAKAAQGGAKRNAGATTAK